MPEPATYGTSPSRAQRKPGLAESYAALETLLRASPRGRWFLAEYARRNRTAETELLLEALVRIETAVTNPKPRHGAPGNIFAELIEMSEAIARTRRAIAHIRPPHQLDQFDQQLFDATVELDHIVEATEKATSDILAAAGKVDDIASQMRSFAEQVRDDDWLLHGPPSKGDRLKQDDVDRMLREARGTLDESVAKAAPDASSAAPGDTPSFEPPGPVTLAELDAVKRAALFG